MIKTLDFSNNQAAQDMTRIVMDHRKGTAEDAVTSVLTAERLKDVTENPEPIIGFDLWGHADSHRRRKLKNPAVEIQISDEQENMLDAVMEKEKCDAETAVSYFLTSAMSAYGYHI